MFARSFALIAIVGLSQLLGACADPSQDVEATTLAVVTAALEPGCRVDCPKCPPHQVCAYASASACILVCPGDQGKGHKACPSGPDATYISRDAACVVDFLCTIDSVPFKSPCGCGCMAAGASCGEGFCSNGDVCCNDSCGICTPPDGFCTQEMCTAL